MTRIKICGLKDEACALVAAEAGADFIGLVFAPSPRRITPTRAEKIAALVKQSGRATEVIGLFVNRAAKEVNEIADFCHLDRVQISGDEPWEYGTEINRPLIKVVRISRKQNPHEISATLDQGTKILSQQKPLFLLDVKVKGKYGGTGIPLDWKLVRPVATQFPVIIAGGLTPENVARAIKAVSPWGVDVSSGVEVDGVKHTARIRAFIEAVRRYDAHQS
ncbi:MAG: N-(5'-phosphoribosyl)anthranilate isomerase [Dehalococcoidales bacterium]|jgi:phosphoribosylanthranilate isomerase|nr:N-(5'-phosphoribosyl)anthranilate isomerase [Dehalococcoidales bacterium]MDP6577512.1 phosphoribosylanthranilate isomerase [Dehalococcoidales bacterium]